MFSAKFPIQFTADIYPERKDEFRQVGYGVACRVGIDTPFFMRRRARSFRWIPPAVDAAEKKMAIRKNLSLENAGRELGARIRVNGFRRDLVAECFALVRAVAKDRLGMAHRDVQLIGGGVMLSGMVAEMSAGEGKTLTAALPGCTLALAGIPVHIITLSDYQAQRDAQRMTPIFEALGLTVGTILHHSSENDRRSAYQCHIVYGTGKEIIFDYLRDFSLFKERPSQVRLKVDRLVGEQSKTGRLLLRGLHFAIVDDADSILIDEARTPVAISDREHQTTAKISYQRFFRRYLGLAGMSGTAREVAGELRNIYRLPTVILPAHRSTKPTVFSDYIFSTTEEKIIGLLEGISEMHQRGRPLVVGVRSPEVGLALSDLLQQRQIPHELVNELVSESDDQKAARAGQPGQVTVITLKAGKASTIPTAPEHDEGAGIHVVATERFESRRIDRQLLEMCGMQGQTGSYQAMVALSDEVIVQHGPKWMLLVLGYLLKSPFPALAQQVGAIFIGCIQRRAERRAALIRQDMLRIDQQLGQTLAFAGRSE